MVHHKTRQKGDSLDIYRQKHQTRQIVNLITALFLSTVAVSCSQSRTVSEEDLLKVLVQINHVGPLNFRRDVWPSLKDKTITYCGQLQEVKTMEAHTLVLIKVEKQSGGENLPWSLEGKSASPDVARSYKPGDPLCMTGTIESFAEVQEHLYWGYVQIVSLANAAATK